MYRVFFKEWSVLLPGSLRSLLKHLSSIWGLTTAVSVPHGWPTQLANCFGDLAAPNKLINVPRSHQTSPPTEPVRRLWTCRQTPVHDLFTSHVVKWILKPQNWRHTFWNEYTGRNGMFRLERSRSSRWQLYWFQNEAWSLILCKLMSKWPHI